MMKMIIILTNKADVTSDFVVRELRNQRLEYYRLNTEDIPQKIDVIFSIEDDKFVLVDKIKNIYCPYTCFLYTEHIVNILPHELYTF